MNNPVYVNSLHSQIAMNAQQQKVLQDGSLELGISTERDTNGQDKSANLQDFSIFSAEKN